MKLIREDIDRIATEYLNDTESTFEMEEIIELADKALRLEKAIEDIKAEIENMSILSSVDIKTGKTIYEGLCRHSDVLEIIDKHIGGNE